MGAVSLEQEVGEVWGPRLITQRPPESPRYAPSPRKKAARVMSHTAPPPIAYNCPISFRIKVKFCQWSVCP